MTHTASSQLGPLGQLGALCRGDAQLVDGWLHEHTADGLRRCALAIVIGGGLYGLTVGMWRAPEMGLYVAIKLPLLIFLVLFANGLINGMFASLLGSGLSFRQTLMMSLISFTTVSLILGALSPVTFFLALNAPGPDTPQAVRWHGIFLISHTALIAYAGIVGNYKAYVLLARFTGQLAAARRTFLAWLAVNLFVGAQLSFILRPFFGNPAMDVRFLRENAFDGSFYEVVYRILTDLL